MSRAPTLPARPKAFSVFEVMLALAIFSLVMLGLALCLEKTIDASLAGRRENTLRHNLESRLALARQRPLQVGEQELDPDANGVRYTSEVTPLELKNQKNVNLNNLYRLTLRARWKENNTDQERTATLYVYQP